jgi:hypothetical protein
MSQILRKTEFNHQSQIQVFTPNELAIPFLCDVGIFYGLIYLYIQSFLAYPTKNLQLEKQ